MLNNERPIHTEDGELTKMHTLAEIDKKAGELRLMAGYRSEEEEELEEEEKLKRSDRKRKNGGCKDGAIKGKNKGGVGGK